MFRRFFVFVVALAMMLGPGGAGEAMENLVHLTVSGHTAHHQDDAADEHSHQDLEHGCVGGFHVCACCSHQAMLFAQHDLEISMPSAWMESLTIGFVALGPSGTRGSIFRPPIA